MKGLLKRLRPKTLRLAARVFIALAGLLSVAILVTSATLLYNAATALRDEAELNTVVMAELLADGYADIGGISLANISRALDSTLDEPMIAQALMTAHLVAAAEEAGYDPPGIIEMLEAIVESTVLDEFWITDETGFSYLTNVRDENGDLIPFRFDPDPAVQPQASIFYTLLSAPLDGVEFITQPAQTREIDQRNFKYVGVGGVDRPRIVQVGDFLVEDDTELMRNVYASQRADVSALIEGILGLHMIAQTTILDHFIAVVEEAGWTTDAIEAVLERIVDNTTISEIRILEPERGVVYSNVPSDGGSRPLADVPHFADLDSLLDGSETVIEHAASLGNDGVLYKHVTRSTGDASRLTQVGIPVQSSSGNLLYSVYQQQADLQVENRNVQALWIVNLDGEVAAAAPRAETQTGDVVVDTAGIFDRRAETILDDAMQQEGVVSAASLSLFSPEDRGVVVATPFVNDGGIPLGGLAIAYSLDDIATRVRVEARNTALIAFLLLGLTAVAALFGSRLLTRPIEAIADAARQVETGEQPDPGAMEPVMNRSDEIGSLARVFSDMTVQVFNREEQLETLVSERTKELQQSNQQLRIAHEAMEEDLATAKVVQHALVREGGADLGAFSAYARMTPAKQVGGDFVDVVGPSGGMVFFVIGDVSGKGVAAALFMAASQSAVKSAFLGRADIATIAAAIAAIAEDTNRRLCSQNPMGMFVTCMLALVNLESGAVDYVCAGHEPPFVIGADDSRRALPLTGGLAMGLMEDFDYSSGHAVLQPGETLFLYTDGLTDATNRTGELFGKQRLEGTLDGSSLQSPEQIVNNVWDRIGQFSAGTPPADDMTCLVLRRRQDFPNA